MCSEKLEGRRQFICWRKRTARDLHGAAAHLRVQHAQIVVVMNITKMKGPYQLIVKRDVKGSYGRAIENHDTGT